METGRTSARNAKGLGKFFEMKIKVDSGGRLYEVVVKRVSRSEFQVEVNGRMYPVVVLVREGEQLVLSLGGRIEHLVVWGRETCFVARNDQVFELQIQDPRRSRSEGSTVLATPGSVQVKASMPGKIVAVLKQQGEKVEEGEGLVIVESMKMQNELKSPKSGRVAICNVQVDASVEGRQLLFQIE